MLDCQASRSNQKSALVVVLYTPLTAVMLMVMF